MEPEPQLPPDQDTKATRGPSRKVIITALVAALIISGTYVYNRTTTPSSFTQNATLEIESGMSVLEISEAAAENGLVKSPLFLYAILTYFYDPTNIYAGRYVFTAPVNVFGVAAQLASNSIEEDLVRLTFPEGISIAQMATIAQAALPAFDAASYTTASSAKEGYLFPETYLVPDTFTATDVITLQNETFASKVTTLEPLLASSTLTLDEVVILASIIEREANDEPSMKMVSGIFQNRLEIGMALQADASIEYALATPLNELKAGELAQNLRDLDSPYNTYLYPGLPPTPIGNPGLQALEAALNPTPSDFFYYITGTDGEFYYAETLDQHNENIRLHLQ